MWEGITKAMEEEGNFNRNTQNDIPYAKVYSTHIPVWPDLTLCGDTLEWCHHDTLQYQ